MIVVEIPAALAADPQVVPVDLPHRCDGSPGCRSVHGHHHGCFADRCSGDMDHHPTFWALNVDPLSSLVGQRVALAWRETCLTCAGQTRYEGDGWVCPDDCNDGERMVVGWTAEVAAVVPIVNRDTPAGAMARGPRVIVVSHYHGRGGAVWVHGLDKHNRSLPPGTLDAADWSPGRYALVLRDARRPATTMTCDWCGQAIFWGFPAPDDPCPECQRPVRMPTACRPFFGFAKLDEVIAESRGR